MPDRVLPDCRSLRRTGGMPTKTIIGFVVPIYCANCGKEGGRVPENHMTFAFWLCNNCFEEHGPIAATMVTPDEVFWRRVQEDQ